MRRLSFLAVVLGVALACGRDDAADRAPAPPAAGVVDSALPIDTLLHRFRAAIADTPSTLSGGAPSPEALTRALLTAITGRDTAALRALVVSRAEFAWLYYPHTIYVRPPYALGPELVWMQQLAGSSTGATRLLQRYGGSAMRLDALLCPDSVTVEGPNRLLVGCRVRFAAADSAPREMRLFGALLNRDGRYKFLTYANDL